jgi:hypothetical protein
LGGTKATEGRRRPDVDEEGTGECTRNDSFIIAIPFFMSLDALIFN